MNEPFSTGALKSPYDIRTFTYIPDKASIKGGEKWLPTDIDHQHKVGICTAISSTMRAQKNFGIKFSADFQYLMQKRSENNWDEGSSIATALKIGKNVGYLPYDLFPIKEEDRNLSYADYILKLQAIPEADITKYVALAAQYKLKAYASVPVSRELLANAIDNDGSLLIRMDVGQEWWTSISGVTSWASADIEPLRSPKVVISGHAINETKYDGDSFRIANSWGVDWADAGTAYHILSDYAPTEAWAVWFNEVPKVIADQVDSRSSIIGQILDLIQKIIVLVAKLK